MRFKAVQAPFRHPVWRSVASIALAATLVVGSAVACAETIEDKAALCGACHGLKGLPEDKSIPIIWGQQEGYLYLQFRDFQRGARKDERMTAVAQNVVKEDALKLAEYFAAKPWPATGAPAASKAETEAAKGAIKTVVCTSCHLDHFQGDSSVPRLAGQQRDYLLKTMTDFHDGARGNNPGMSSLIRAVTPEQRAAIADYLAGL